LEEEALAKIAIVTDSNSGITQRQAAELGISVVPMPFDIDGKTYYEDISLTQEEFYIKLNGNADISTTQPSPENVMDMWRKLLEDHESVIYIPMSSGLSGSCQTAMVFSMEDEFDGKVFVIDNQRISVTQRQAVLDAKLMADEGIAVEEIVKYLMDTKMESSIYIMVDTLKYLKKGGRVTPAAAALGTILKLKPVLQIQGEKLDAFAKARTLTQAKNIMINAVKADVEKRFGGNVNNVHLEIAHTHNLQEALNFKEEVAAAFPEYQGQIYVDHLSLSVSCHIGPGSLALAATKRM
jgi:DegV family protein with EDD domain